MNLLELQQTIDKAANAYYNKTSIVDDSVYDNWVEELRKLSPADIRLTRVGYDVRDSMLEKTELRIPMGSQSKANSREEYQDWLRNNIYKSGISKDERFVASHKMDGMSLELSFMNGRLIRAVTRGNSVIGENITSNALLFKGIPSKSNFSGYVRGEVVLTMNDWDNIDSNKESNPRNLVSLARRKDGSQSDSLTFYAFKLYDIDANPIGNTEEEAFRKLKEIGFNVVEYVVGNSEEVWKWYENVTPIRQKLGYWIDGIIIVLNSIKLQEQLGESNNRPKSSIAIKFEAESATSVLLGVDFSVGHGGNICPVARFTPCQIGGTTIEFASLYNFDNIDELDLYINDEIEVKKCNDIIPAVTRVLSKGKNRISIIQPTKCPCCNGKVEKKENISGIDSVAIYCVNENCPAQVNGKLEKWVKSLDIQGLGESIIQSLLSSKLIETAADLYLLKNKETELCDLMMDGKTRLGEKRAQKILDNIENKRKLSLSDFLGSLGIPTLGKRRVRIVQDALMGKMDKLENWLDGKTLIANAAQSSLPNAVFGINQELVKQKENINKYITNGVEIIMENTNKNIKEGTMLFVLTGPPGCLKDGEKVTKEYYHDAITKAGHQFASSYTKETDYLVTADSSSTSSKMEKARKNGTKIISHAELMKLIGQ